MQGAQCITLVRSLVDELEIRTTTNIKLGEITVDDATAADKLYLLIQRLADEGLQVITDKKSILAEKIRLVISQLLSSKNTSPENYSVYLSQKLGLSYNYLATVFAEVHGQSVEHYIISQKIAAAKVLLIDESLNINEIAEKMRYRTAGHFSFQFRKETGMTPSEYRTSTRSRFFKPDDR